MPSDCTCTGCGNLMGCSGDPFFEEEAPLYAEIITAPAARSIKPGIAVHFLRSIIRISWCAAWGEALCERFHKAPIKRRNLAASVIGGKSLNDGFCVGVEYPDKIGREWDVEDFRCAAMRATAKTERKEIPPPSAFAGSAHRQDQI